MKMNRQSCLNDIRPGERAVVTGLNSTGAMRRRLLDILPVLLLILGAVAVALGVWLIFEPAGYIVGGVLLMAAAILMIRGGGGHDND